MISEEQIKKAHLRLLELTNPAEYETNIDAAMKMTAAIKEAFACAGIDNRLVLLACTIVTAEGIARQAKTMDDAMVGLRAWQLGVEQTVKGIFELKESG